MSAKPDVSMEEMLEWVNERSPKKDYKAYHQRDMQIVQAIRSHLSTPGHFAIRIRKLMEQIEAEPMATGEPAESVQIGRLQVLDELMAIDRQGVPTDRDVPPCPKCGCTTVVPFVPQYECSDCDAIFSQDAPDDPEINHRIDEILEHYEKGPSVTKEWVEKWAQDIETFCIREGTPNLIPMLAELGVEVKDE